MCEQFNVVPWYNSDEWLTVYDKIFSPTSSYDDKLEALNLLMIWKMRCPSLPSGIESTLTLLEVYVQDSDDVDNVNGQMLIRLAYSSAIMRFVNHMLDTETAKGSSLYQAAKNLGVPDWIIDLRHDTAHNNNLPTIELLRDATSISLEWLHKNYWLEYKEKISDYFSGQKELETPEENKIAVVMNFCISLSFCSYPKHKIKNLADIPDQVMRDSIVSDAKDLFGNSISLCNLKTVSISQLIKLLNTHSKKLLKSKNTSALVNSSLLGTDSIFLSLELFNFLNESNLDSKNVLSKHYVQCFEILLTFLQRNELLLDFILELIKISKESEDKKQCKLSALWASRILKMLRNCRLFTQKYRSVANDLETRTRDELIQMYFHWFPNEKSNGMILDLQRNIPVELLSINYIKPILSSYNAFLHYFIKDLLMLVKPQLPKPTVEKIYELACLISSPDGFPINTEISKIYTIEDIKERKVSDNSKSNDSDDCEEVEPMEVDSLNVEKETGSIWKLTSRKCNWANCPIGQLPRLHE